MGTPHLPAQCSDPLALPSRSEDRITILRAFHTIRHARHRPWPGSRAAHEPSAGAVEYYPTARCAIGIAPVHPVIPRARSLEAKGVVAQVVDTIELRRNRPPEVEARMHRLQLRRSVQPLFKAVNAWEAEGRSQGNRRSCFGLNHRSFIQIFSRWMDTTPRDADRQRRETVRLRNQHTSRETMDRANVSTPAILRR